MHEGPIKNLATSMKVESNKYCETFGHHFIKVQGVRMCTECFLEVEVLTPPHVLTNNDQEDER